MTNTTLAPVFTVRVTDRLTGTDHLVDDAAYTRAKLTDRPYTTLCGATVEPASLIYPHGPVHERCAHLQAARRLKAAELADQATCRTDG